MREAELFDNITVLSLEQATVLPYLTYRLAMDGAHVIRMEHPSRGDPNRYIGDNRLDDEQMNTYFLPINAGKKAITLNLSHPRGKELLGDIIRQLDVDIFCTNQLPKNYVKLGIDYDSLRTVKPDLIWLGVTGFGVHSNEAAYDPVLQARSGLMDLTGETAGLPMVTGIPFIDMGTSEHGYGSIMKALYKRVVTGQGSCLNLSMFQSALSWLTVPISLGVTFGYSMRRHGNTHEFFAPVSVYETRDGYVYVAVGNERQWQSLVSLAPFAHLNQQGYKTNAGRIADVANLNAAINKATRTLTTGELASILQSVQIPVSEVRTVGEVVKDPVVEKMLLSAYDVRTGLELTMAPPPYDTPYLEACRGKCVFPPRFGEHNREIYGKVLGYDDETLTWLQREQVI